MPITLTKDRRTNFISSGVIALSFPAASGAQALNVAGEAEDPRADRPGLLGNVAGGAADRADGFRVGREDALDLGHRIAHVADAGRGRGDVAGDVAGRHAL